MLCVCVHVFVFWTIMISTHSKLKAIPINSIKSYIHSQSSFYRSRSRVRFCLYRPAFDCMNIKLLLCLYLLYLFVCSIVCGMSMNHIRPVCRSTNCSRHGLVAAMLFVCFSSCGRHWFVWGGQYRRRTIVCGDWLNAINCVRMRSKYNIKCTYYIYYTSTYPYWGAYLYICMCISLLRYTYLSIWTNITAATSGEV